MIVLIIWKISLDGIIYFFIGLVKKERVWRMGRIEG